MAPTPSQPFTPIPQPPNHQPPNSQPQLVFFMQCGFIMMESGFSRAKSVRNVLLKNCISVCLAAFCWWALGYAFAHGRSKAGGFIGCVPRQALQSVSLGGPACIAARGGRLHRVRGCETVTCKRRRVRSSTVVTDWQPQAVVVPPSSRSLKPGSRPHP